MYLVYSPVPHVYLKSTTFLQEAAVQNRQVSCGLTFYFLDKLDPFLPLLTKTHEQLADNSSHKQITFCHPQEITELLKLALHFKSSSVSNPNVLICWRAVLVGVKAVCLMAKSQRKQGQLCEVGVEV